MHNLKTIARAKAEKWLQSNINPTIKKQIKELLIAPDQTPLINNFYKSLEFGTGGLRGIIGVGPNCMNQYTVGAATQGLSNYLLKTFPETEIRVAIAFDCRRQSKEFAQITAHVFSANGIIVYLFPELRPTPLLSFAIRYFKCHSGVNITASHNPKEYNGYKAYWSDGGQLVPPHDQQVIKEVNAIIDFDQIKFTADPAKIRIVGAEVEEAYYAQVLKIIPAQETIHQQSSMPIVFSSLHGTGATMVPECLKRLGFNQCFLVKEQNTPDGNFPTVHSPNPEEHAAMNMALKLATEKNAEIAMATDPDGDRVGLAIKDDNGNFFLLNGNEAFTLMIGFILKNIKETKDRYIAKTIVTTELIDVMAAHFGVACYNTLTGFKYIASLIRRWEGKKYFVAAGEESYGYMVGDFVRDKDGVSACAFFAAMAAVAKAQGKSLYDWLIQNYIDYGYYKEALINLTREGAEGAKQIKLLMEKFRHQAPSTIGGEKVIRMLDFQLQLETDTRSGKIKPIALEPSNVLQFYTEEGTKVSVRPSGTEPKIKFYISVQDKLSSKEDFFKVGAKLTERLKSITDELTGQI